MQSYLLDLRQRGVVAFAVNIGLAVLIGAYLAGWIGAALGLAVVLVGVSAPKALPPLQRALTALGAMMARQFSAVGRALLKIGEALQILLAFALLPIVLAGTMAAALVIHAVNLVLRPFEAPLRAVRTWCADVPARVGSFVEALFTPPNLLLTLANLVAAAIIAGILAQVDFAFYVVFAAVPLMIIVLVSASVDEAEAHR